MTHIIQKVYTNENFKIGPPRYVMSQWLQEYWELTRIFNQRRMKMLEQQEKKK